MQIERGTFGKEEEKEEKEEEDEDMTLESSLKNHLLSNRRYKPAILNLSNFLLTRINQIIFHTK